MKLNGHFLNDMTAMNALAKINDATGLPADTAYRVGKIYKRCQKEIRDLSDKALAVHRKYCKMDEKGLPCGIAEGKLVFNDPRLEPDHDREFHELLDQEFEEETYPVPMEHLNGLGLSSKELVALEPILNFD